MKRVKIGEFRDRASELVRRAEGGETIIILNKIATMAELKRALGTETHLTVLRKLKTLGYRSSYTHRGAYYTLTEVARFGDEGLWSHEGVWFSRH